MNSYERVLTTLRHGEPDRVPFDLGSTLVTGMTRRAYDRLAADLGRATGPVEMYDTIQQLPEMAEGILEALEVDVRGLIPNFARKRPALEERENGQWFTDEWGIRWYRPVGAGYFSVAEAPLGGEISVGAIEDYPWPRGDEPELLAGLEERARAYAEKGYAIILENVCAGIFEMSCRMRGTEQFYMDLSLNPELAERLLEKWVEVKLAYYEAAAERLGEHVLMVKEADDMAGQERLLMSPGMYRDLIKPRHRRLFEAQRRLFAEPFFVFLHSDGAIFEILPDFIEIGVEVLNPVQVTARGMGAARVKREFGKYLCFWGGGVDTQEVLPRGEAAAVRAEVRTRIGELAPGGGYVFGTVHNIQDDVPVENVRAMLEAYRACRAYPM